MARADQVFHSREAIERQLGFSQTVRIGQTIYFSGVVSIDAHANVLDPDDMAAQIRNVYGELKDLLLLHGITVENVVKETIYTTNVDALVANAAVRLEQFAGAVPPAATWVEVRRLFRPELKLEVDWIAHVPEGVGG